MLTWIRGECDSGTVPTVGSLSYRVISDTYGVFVYDADADFVRGVVCVPRLPLPRLAKWRHGDAGQGWNAFRLPDRPGVDGPRKGERLTPIPTVGTIWGPWLKANPGTVAYAMVSQFQPPIRAEVVPARVAAYSGPSWTRGWMQKNGCSA